MAQPLFTTNDNTAHVYKYIPNNGLSIHCNIPDSQIPAAELDLIEQRMYPGKFCEQGFLKENERLADVIRADNDYLRSVSMTHKQIANILGSIVDCCNQYYVKHNLILDDPPLLVDNKFVFTREQYMGAQICPFKNDAVDANYHGEQYGDTDVTITNPDTKETITFNNLLIHMISQHRFFESPNCEHRLNPADVIKMFSLKPGVEPPTEHYVSMINAIPSRDQMLNHFLQHVNVFGY